MKNCGLKLKFFRRFAFVLVKLVGAVAETGHRRFYEPVCIYPFNFETSHVNRSAWYGKSDERLRGSGNRFSVFCCFYFFQASENENSPAALAGFFMLTTALRRGVFSEPG